MLPPPLTLESLRQPHGSIARNPRICEALFLTHYIEKYGTGTLMMIRESLAHALPEPDFAQRGGEFTITVWRDWLTDDVLARFHLNERQRQALAHLKTHGKISNAEYQQIANAIKKTATRDLNDLKGKGIVEQRGSRGPGVHYVLAKRGDIKRTLGT
jgi:ATP-dependent DNA helicase RecG